MKTVFPTILLTVAFLGAMNFNTAAQVLYDFEDGAIDQWNVELDGIPILSTAGNPGNCLLIDDQALGSVNQLITPLPFTGDWSNATSTDSFSFDLFARKLT